jgi:2-methylisocitrate lyase-like PEP mutase family enzyme
MKKTTKLRKLLKEPGLLIVPAAYDCLSARCVEATGFKAVFQTGAGVRECALGMPDIGMATATEIINCCRYISDSVTIPLIVDADDAFGAMLSAYHNVQQLIRAGASGMFISDRAPFILATEPHAVVDVLPRNEYYGKMKAAIEARNKEDKDFVLVARIDSGAKLGDEEVLIRAKECLKLGVDVILPHFRPPESKFGERNKETLKQLYKKIGAPDVWIWGMGPYTFTAEDYVDVGAKLWVTGRVASVVSKALIDFYTKFHETGVFPLDSFDLAPPGPAGDKLQELRGLDEWGEVEKRNAVK